MGRHEEGAQARAAAVRVMSWNILFSTSRSPAGPWERRRPLVTELIRGYAPDVVGLQEVTDRQLEDLSRDLPEYELVPGSRSGRNKMPYASATLSPLLLAAGLLLRPGRRGESRLRQVLSPLLLAAAAAPPVMSAIIGAFSGTAILHGAYSPILYRRDRLRLDGCGEIDLAAKPDDPLALLIGTWLPRLANWARLMPLSGGPPVTIYNVHLDPMSLGTRPSARVLRRHMDLQWDGTPQLALGDFNGELSDARSRHLTRDATAPPPGFRSAWDLALQRTGPEKSFHAGLGQAWPFVERMDHVLVRPAGTVPRITTVTDHEGRLYPSDHYPLVADLVVPEREPRLPAVAPGPRSERA